MTAAPANPEHVPMKTAKHALRKLLGIAIYVLAFIMPVVALGTIGYSSTISLATSKPDNPARAETGPGAQHTKPFDPTKPTVAIVLGDDRTESTDFLIPYELFSAARDYNVYAVAPERQLTTLSGGLDVLPDLSYAELDTLLGKSPDVVVIPAIPVRQVHRMRPSSPGSGNNQTTDRSSCRSASAQKPLPRRGCLMVAPPRPIGEISIA
jgi:hypothetical protein